MSPSFNRIFTICQDIREIKDEKEGGLFMVLRTHKQKADTLAGTTG